MSGTTITKDNEENRRMEEILTLAVFKFLEWKKLRPFEFPWLTAAHIRTHS